MAVAAAPFVLQRLPVLQAADAHDHAHGVADDVFTLVLAIGPGLAKGRDRRHYEGGIQRFEVAVTQTEPGQVARLVALDDNIDMGYQASEDGPASGIFQVEGGALLVQVEQQEEQALFRVWVVVEEGRHTSQGRTLGRLQLQNIGAVIGQ